jgi:hypothetical protein
LNGDDVSIYATLWSLKFPDEGDDYIGCDWIEVIAQGVPAHVGSQTPGCGYEGGDPYAAFLPPSIGTDEDGNSPYMRAVVFVTRYSAKGTERSPQEYASPLLVLTGEEYSRITFEELRRRLCDALRGNRPPVIAEILQPNGKHTIIRAKDKEEDEDEEE